MAYSDKLNIHSDKNTLFEASFCAYKSIKRFCSCLGNSDETLRTYWQLAFRHLCNDIISKLNEYKVLS
jgi:hypothetical protein